MIETPEKRYVLERVSDTNVLQLYCDDFANLDLNEKLFAYYLTKAAIAGRTIAIDQSSPRALSIKDTMERMFESNEVSGQEKEKIHCYLKEIWLHNGIHHHWTHQKSLLNLSEPELIRLAKKAGVDVSRIIKVMVEQSVEPLNCNKTAEDIIKESYNNFYSGVSFVEADKWAKDNEKYSLNSKLVKNEDGTLEEIVWRCGNAEVAKGMYAVELSRVNYFLEMASKYASNSQRVAISHLVKFFETGEKKRFEDFNIAWVGYQSRVDFILGFIETYLDARDAKGYWEGIIYATDTEATSIMSRLGKEAQYFENRMPWSDKYKNPNAKPLDFKVANAIFACGGSGPFMFIGVNLPNDNKIREQYGSKSVMLKNVMEAYSKTSQKELLREFAWDENEIALEEKWGTLHKDLHVAMHEVLGHASGKMARSEEPNKLLPGLYSTLEEARADLCALWLIGDPKLVEMGLVSEIEPILRATYQNYVRNGGLVQLFKVPEADVFEEDHLKNRQLIVHYIMENSEAIDVRQKNGKTYFCVRDFEKMRFMVGKLLAEIMRIKAEGDLWMAKQLVLGFGTVINKKLRDEVVRRAREINIPAFSAFVMPEPRLISENGYVKDVLLHYPMDLTSQMLRFKNM